MGVQIFNQTLTGSFEPSSSVLLNLDRWSLLFKLVVTGGATAVQFYFEFSEDLITWFHEIDEQDIGNGVVSQAKVVRTFKENGGANLAIGTHNLSGQYPRQAKFARLQMAASGGTAVATVTSQFGISPQVA